MLAQQLSTRLWQNFKDVTARSKYSEFSSHALLLRTRKTLPYTKINMTDQTTWLHCRLQARRLAVQRSQIQSSRHISDPSDRLKENTNPHLTSSLPNAHASSEDTEMPVSFPTPECLRRCCYTASPHTHKDAASRHLKPQASYNSEMESLPTDEARTDPETAPITFAFTGSKPHAEHSSPLHNSQNPANNTLNLKDVERALPSLKKRENSSAHPLRNAIAGNTNVERELDNSECRDWHAPLTIRSLPTRASKDQPVD